MTSFGKSWDLPNVALGLESNQNAFITCLMSNLVEESLDKLRALGLRVTDQRRAILSALDRSEAPKSAEEIHAALPELSLIHI